MWWPCSCHFTEVLAKPILTVLLTFLADADLPHHAVAQQQVDPVTDELLLLAPGLLAGVVGVDLQLGDHHRPSPVPEPGLVTDLARRNV